MQFDLRSNENALHLLAPFKVLAYMCHPQVRLVPADGTLLLELEGDLAGILAISESAKPGQFLAPLPTQQSQLRTHKLSQQLGAAEGRAPNNRLPHQVFADVCVRQRLRHAWNNAQASVR